MLLDPNAFSADGTTQLAAFALSKDAQVRRLRHVHRRLGLAGLLRDGGRDRKTLPDELNWVKVSGIAWQGDGFYYSRYPEPAQGKELTASNDDHQVYYHQVGTPQSPDELVFEDARNPQRFHTVATTEDERFAILNVSERGKGKDGNALFFRDLERGGHDVDAAHRRDRQRHVRRHRQRRRQASRRDQPRRAERQVVLVDPQRERRRETGTTSLPEKPEPLESASTAGGKLFATYLKDVTTRAYVLRARRHARERDRAARPRHRRRLRRQPRRHVHLLHLHLVHEPPTIYRYDIATRKTTLFRAPEIPGFNAADYETQAGVLSRARTARASRCSSSTRRA